jgi:hypothetical protein
MDKPIVEWIAELIAEAYADGYSDGFHTGAGFGEDEYYGDVLVEDYKDSGWPERIWGE